MKSLEREELSNVLIDVRKAYRLLYLYQRRVMDTVRFIGDVLSKNIQDGYALYGSSSPKTGAKISLNESSWDWLNMYFYEFHFQNEIINSNEIIFSIAIQSDNGGWFNEIDMNKRLDIGSYSSVEESNTRFIFFIGKNRWKPGDGADRENYHEFIKNNIDSHFILKKQTEKNEVFIAQSYLLKDFANEDNILEKLKNLINICSDNGINEFSLTPKFN